MKKMKLLEELHKETYVTLRPSTVNGIGVFAIRDIEKGTKNIFSKSPAEWISVSKEEVSELPLHARGLIENHCLYDDENYFIPEYGFKLFDLIVFLNHDDNPNLISVNDGEYFETLRDIKCGEELFVDYGTIVG